MDQHRLNIASMKRKLNTVFHPQHLLNSHNKSSTEKLPPRLQVKGMSIAARVMGHEIREFAFRKTGKDLAKLRENKTRNKLLSNISKLKNVLTNNEAKYSYLLLACNHNSNFITSLTPEGVEYFADDTDFEQNSLRDFIAQYHKRCFPPDEVDNTQTKKRPSPYFRKTLYNKPDTLIEDYEYKNLGVCTCNQQERDINNKLSYLQCWQHKGINEKSLDSYFEENVDYFLSPDKKDTASLGEEWSEFIRNDKCLVFRKKIGNGIYEYRVQATFFDISANHLFRTQIDGEYRKKWDEYIIDLKVVDRDEHSNTDLVHWITKCPYPFATREYVYLRRQKINNENKTMILYQEKTDDTNIPIDYNIHRVDTYVSKIIIKPHDEDFDKKGCDFLLTYYDNPKMMLPTTILDMAASKGIRDSVDRMHQAALGLNK